MIASHAKTGAAYLQNDLIGRSGSSGWTSIGLDRPLGRSKFNSRKAEARVICGPAPVRIAQNRFEHGRDFIEKSATLIRRQCGTERIGERFQPPAHAGWQRRGARNELYAVRHKSGSSQTDFVFVDSWEVPRNPRRGVSDPS